MGFIRVRSASGPHHEFDTSEAAYALRPGAYVVIDATPVAEPRPTVYVKPERASRRPASKQKKQARPRPRPATAQPVQDIE